jgi:HopA1 effector protein family
MTLTPEIRADVLAAVRLARSPAGAAALAGGTLEEFLYTRWFARVGDAGAAGSSPPDGAVLPPLAARLTAAHAASTRLEAGWSARRVGRDGAVLAQRGSELLEVRPPDYVNLDHPAAPVRVGDALAVTARRAGLDREGGWWLTAGRAGPAATAAMLRVYWNCPSGSAAALVARLTEALEDIRLPYTLKCPSVEALFDRVEPVVLYLGVAEWAAAKESLGGVHASLVDRLRAPVPALTLRLGAGAAVAEDPGDGTSFGQSRSRAVADGLARAAGQDLTDEEAALSVVASRLSAHGISPLRPYQRESSPPELVRRW